MPFKQPELLLKYDEYLDTWVGLVQEFYQRVISDDAIFTALQLDEEAALQFSREVSTVLVVIAMRMWKQKKLRDDVKRQVESDVVSAVYRRLFSAEDEILEACRQFYTDRYVMFEELAPLGATKDVARRREQMVGFARYVVAQCSDRPEKQNAPIIEKLSLYIIQAADVCIHLTNQSSMDMNSLSGKRPRFLVER